MRTSYLFGLALTLAGCLAPEETSVKLSSRAKDAAAGDAATAGSMDSAAGEGGASTGDSGAKPDAAIPTDGSTGRDGSLGEDAGKQCNKPCPMPDKSYCDPEIGDCAACKTAMHCAAFRTTTPECKAGVGCVQCTDDTNGDTLCKMDGKVCKAGANVCVECNVTGDCMDPEKSVCAGDECIACSEDVDCQHIPGKRVCDKAAKKCVPCFGARNADCSGGTKVCDMLAAERVCSTKDVASAQVCQPCVSDKQCQVGQLCVQMFADSDGNTTKDAEVGWFCQWVPDSGGNAPLACNTSARPYVGEATVASADDPEGSTLICTLSASSCPALLESYRDPCGRFGSGASSIVVEDRFDPDIPGNPVAKELISPDDSVCGLGGKCVKKNDAAGSYQCSVPCGINNDCPTSIASTCGGAPPGTANVCGI